MYISMNWIKDYIDLKGLDEKELINKFTVTTAEVEGITEHGINTSGVVVGKVLEVEAVENSTKLHKVIVDIGKAKVQSICGAPNVAKGQTIAFAPSGSTVCGIEVKPSILASLDSFGVCLSEKELGISDSHKGIMILDDKYAAGTDIKEIIPLDDIVFEIDNKSLTNRPDLWGHYGIAREFAAITGRKLKDIDTIDLEEFSKLPKLSVRVQSDKCYRYSALAVENITKNVSSLEMKTRLYYTGLRSINLLADITNYIMLELGQPMHAFDKQLVSNIVVKTLNKEQDFITLDGIKHSINTSTLMICDNEKPIAIAGIMGGENTEIRDNTNSLLLESATFDSMAIRKSTTSLGLRTDASTRYEKTLDPELTVLAIKRYLKLLKEIDKNATVTSSLADVYTKKYDTVKITIDTDYICRHIGEEIDANRIEKILNSLCFTTTRKGNNFEITVPSYRATKDVTSKADIVEEIARIYGYDRILPKTCLSPLLPIKEDESRVLEYDIKKLLAEKFGLSEVHSYVWFDTKLNNELNIKTRDNIKIINSLNSDDSTLRYSMVPTLLNMVYNNLKNYSNCNIFEIGRVFNYSKPNAPVDERKVLGITLAESGLTDEQQLFNLKKIINSICHISKNLELDFVFNEIVKESWIHPVNSFTLCYNKQNVGYVTVLHPTIKNSINKKTSIVVAEIYMDDLNKIKAIDRKYAKFTKYQTVDVDLSLTVNDSTLYSNIQKIIENTKLEFLLTYNLIDIYENKSILQDKKNITIRFTLGSFNRTLTSEEINVVITKLILTFEQNGIVIKK